MLLVICSRTVFSKAENNERHEGFWLWLKCMYTKQRNILSTGTSSTKFKVPVVLSSTGNQITNILQGLSTLSSSFLWIAFVMKF